MTYGGQKKPLQESASPPFRREQQDFSSWLRSLSLEKLHDVYRQYAVKNEIANRQQEAMDTKKDETSGPEKIILRKSIFFLITYVIGVELMFDLLYVVFRIPMMYVKAPVSIQGYLTYSYFILFVVINVIKLLCVTVGVLRWVTNVYILTQDGIHFKYGIISKKEKIFLCANMQEVMYSQGFWGRIFNFGSIEIYNPAVKEKIFLDSIPNPSKYTEMIKKSLPATQNAPASFINVQN